MAHFRNVLQAEGCAQIQQYIAKNKTSIEEFVRFENIIQSSPSRDKNSDFSLLEVEGQNIVVTLLGEPLKHIPAERRFALDKTTISPRVSPLKAYTTTNSVPLSIGHASIWTLLPILRGNGTVVAICSLQRCRSLPVDAVKFSATHEVCVGATQNAQQSDGMWLAFAKHWLPLCGTSYQKPGIAFFDAHSTYLTPYFIQFTANHVSYVDVEPSHTSMILQMADVGNIDF